MSNLKASLEQSLREVGTRCAMHREPLVGILLHLESELLQTQDCAALLNVRGKLEADVTTCWKPAGKRGRLGSW